MKSYKLNIKVIIGAVAIFSLIVFSFVLVIFQKVTMVSISYMLIDYAYIIAPTSLVWIWVDRYLWHTKIFQMISKSANIPPDLRGRWEGTLENENSTEIQKFVIEVKQTLTTLKVLTYTSLGRSASILPEIAISENDDTFALCYLWEGNMNTLIKSLHQREHFHGYTILHFEKFEDLKTLKGFYFTNRSPLPTRGGIQVEWVSKELKRKLD